MITVAGDVMRKHTKRRHYATGYMLLPSQRDAIILPVHIALDAIETGHGEITHRHTIAALLNIADVCAKRMVGVAEETLEMIVQAKEAMVSVDKRYLRTGKWGFSGEEMIDIRAAITVSDELLRRVNSAVLSSAVDYVRHYNDKMPHKLGSLSEPLGDKKAFG